MTDAIKTKAKDLSNKFADQISPDTREGYEGYLVKAEDVLEIFQYCRDELGYDYLSSVTSTDYIDEGYFEVVYHLYRSTGGKALVLKCRTQDRENPAVPSLYDLYPSSDLQEREVWDLMGIRFEGHPDLRRVLLWEGFEGHPLRKDWKEPYYEEETKPFSSRWPEAKVHRAEDENAYGKNVQYPQGIDPFTAEVDDEETLYEALRQSARNYTGVDQLNMDHVIVNMGPQHPSTHGVFRMVVMLDGETIVALKPVMGYLHRNHEKIGERNTYPQIMPYTDRLDYITSMSNNWGYALAVEKLLGEKGKPTERAEYLRVIMAELTRISNHVWAIGFLLNDLGAFFTPALYAIEERELILDIFEAVSGSRMMCNYFRFGGVARDLPAGTLDKIKDLVYDRLPRKIEELDTYLTKNEIIRTRCEGVAVIKPEEAIALGCAGPVLRASGVPYDVRRADPYGIYDRFDFDVAVHYHGDVYDRYLVRMDEIWQSIRILKQAIEQMPEGAVLERNPYQVRVPEGEAYGRVEGPKGELGYYVVSNGTANPHRFHVRSPSYINLTSLEKMSVGGKIADAIAALGSIDIILGEVDR